MPAWQLWVLGSAELAGGSGTYPLERKTVALLSFLALEGATSRSKLAGLLWPDSGEKTARNNLAQLLRRLRALTDDELILGGDLLSLSPALEVDAARLKLAMFGGDYRRVLARRGELLAGYDYDDLPDFSDWLYSERERLADLRRSALLSEVSRLEAAGSYGGALEHVHALLEQDPVSEEAHRLAMRLHFLAGDRPAALRAFKRCEEVLRRELEVAPLPETLALMREIEAGRAVLPPERARPSIPLSVLRPPALVGREREWAQLEDAWKAGKLIVVSGPPGVGKTRLMMDFVADKTRVLRSEGRPGDAAVPFLSLTRSFRRFFAMVPELVLEPWIAQELSRLLPDLFAGAPAAEDPLRFHEAMYHVARLVADHTHAIVIDDYQFYDSSSFESGARATSRLVAEGLGAGQARTLVAFRSGEMPAAFVEALSQLVEQDLAVHIELVPLSHQATAALLGSLRLEELSADAASGLASDLHRYTGGNPLFVVETVKNLLETHQLGKRLPASLPPTGRVNALITQRLSRLSPTALHLSWAAAVAQSDFDLELASTVLEENALALAGACEELSRAQVMAGNWFSHDLLFETSLASIPAPVRALLHKRCAGFLEARGANPARVAQHLLDAGEAARAAPFLLRAAEAAQATYQFDKAADLLERAAGIYEDRHEREQAFSAILELARLLMDADLGARLERTLERLEALAATPAARALSLYLRAMHYGRLGRAEQSEDAARRGHVLLGEEDEPKLRSDLLNELGGAFFLQSRLEEALATFKRTLELGERLSKPGDVAASLSNMGVVLDHLERHQEAAAHHQHAAELLCDPKDSAVRVTTLNNLSISQVEQGLVYASLATLETTLTLSEKLSGAEGAQFFTLSLLGACQADLACYCEALDTLERAHSLAERYASYAVGAMERHLARIHLELGRPEHAEALLAAAAVRDTLPSSQQVGIWLARAALVAQEGGDAGDALATARHHLQRADRTSLRVRLLLTEAAILGRQTGLARAREALERLQGSELHGLRIVAEMRCAQLSLALGDEGRAREHLGAATSLGARYQTSDVYPGELKLTRYEVLAAQGDPDAEEALEQAFRWVQRVASDHCPAEYRESFLARNPVNRAILEAADAHGLEPGVS